MKYFGIDGCKKGLFHVQLDDVADFQFGVTSRIEQILDMVRTEDVVLLDIPIGLRM